MKCWPWQERSSPPKAQSQKMATRSWEPRLLYQGLRAPMAQERHLSWEAKGDPTQPCTKRWGERVVPPGRNGEQWLSLAWALSIDTVLWLCGQQDAWGWGGRQGATKYHLTHPLPRRPLKKKNILVKLTPLKRSWVLCRERNLLPKAWLLQRWRPLGRDCGKTPQNTALGPQRGQHPLPPVHQREPQLLSGTSVSTRRFQSPVPSAVCDKDTEL